MEPVQLRKQPVVECDVKGLGVVRVNVDVDDVSRNDFVDVVFITVDVRSACWHDGSCKQGDSLGQESVVVSAIDASIQIHTACSNDDHTSLTKAQTKPSCFRRTSHTVHCCDHSWYEASGAKVRARQCAWSKTFSKFVYTLLHLSNSRVHNL